MYSSAATQAVGGYVICKAEALYQSADLTEFQLCMVANLQETRARKLQLVLVLDATQPELSRAGREIVKH